MWGRGSHHTGAPHHAGRTSEPVRMRACRRTSRPEPWLRVGSPRRRLLCRCRGSRGPHLREVPSPRRPSRRRRRIHASPSVPCVGAQGSATVRGWERAGGRLMSTAAVHLMMLSKKTSTHDPLRGLGHSPSWEPDTARARRSRLRAHPSSPRPPAPLEVPGDVYETRRPQRGLLGGPPTGSPRNPHPRALRRHASSPRDAERALSGKHRAA